MQEKRERLPPQTLRLWLQWSWPWLLVIALFIPLVACQKIPTIGTSSVTCSAFGTITFSASGDTKQTIMEIRSHNAAWRAICASG